jgi:hypothetical protein
MKRVVVVYLYSPSPADTRNYISEKNSLKPQRLYFSKPYFILITKTISLTVTQTEYNNPSDTYINLPKSIKNPLEHLYLNIFLLFTKVNKEPTKRNTIDLYLDSPNIQRQSAT